VVLTPRMIMTIMAIAAIKRAHRPSSRHEMPSHMAQKVAKQAGYVASVVGVFLLLERSLHEADEAQRAGSPSLRAEPGEPDLGTRVSVRPRSPNDTRRSLRDADEAPLRKSGLAEA
jgi:hypothetical protein